MTGQRSNDLRLSGLGIALSFFFVAAFSLAADPAPDPRASLSLDQFLNQVEGGNKAIAAAREASAGAELRVSEAAMIYTPIFEAQAQSIRDKRQSPFLSYDQFINDTLDVGISETTPWGISGKLSYNLTKTGYEGLGRPIYYYGSPRLEMAINLWRNRFGSETRAQFEAIEAGALATRFAQSYQTRVARADAENAYIQLAAARELDEVNRNSFDRANEIFDWNRRRSRLNLGEDSDLFQAEANLEALRLSMRTSADSVRAASRAFNRARGIDGDEVAESLFLPDPKSAKVPERAQVRDDVRAAREQARVAAAQASSGVEKNRPTFEIYGAYAQNSQQIGRSEALRESFEDSQPTKMIGVRFRTSLAVARAGDAVSGYAKERVAAELVADQKIFDQEVEWKDLVQRFTEAKNRLAVAEKLAGIQRRKALNERQRLKKGRTTTYQSLIFETDYNQAEYRRIQTQSEVLSVLAQMKTFGG